LVRGPRLAAGIIGVAVTAVWFPLLIAGIRSLRSRGRLGDSEVLLVTGPYAHVRHPLYAGFSLTAVGLGLILGSRRLVLGGSGWLLVTRLWSVHEDARLAERFGPEYAAYRRTTPALIPDVAGLLKSRLALRTPQPPAD
jgi:protein-S-isoprenylcysteine O-methyltransferase Ste14